jgi:asparagine synthase (glutamine-hydrolysing)
MVMAHSVESRYPFLDIELVEFARLMPPHLKVKDLVEKYPVKRLARDLLPRQIVNREKFGFRAPGSPLLLQRGVEWVEDLLSPEYIRRRGYFDPGAVDRLRQRYSQEGFRLHPHLEPDLLMTVLTFNLLCELFDVPALS